MLCFLITRWEKNTGLQLVIYAFIVDTWILLYIMIAFAACFFTNNYTLGYCLADALRPPLNTFSFANANWS